MTREEFWEWINTCKVHKYEIVNDVYGSRNGYVTVTFKVEEENTND